MAVTEADVRRVAGLARLELSADRASALVTELNDILAHMDVLQGVDMTAHQGSDTEAAGISVLREDTPGSVPLAIAREEFAPEFQDGYFLVPRLATHE